MKRHPSMKKSTLSSTRPKRKDCSSGRGCHQTKITRYPSSRHSVTKRSTRTATRKPNHSCPPCSPLQSYARHPSSKSHSTSVMPTSVGQKSKTATKAAVPAVRTCVCNQTTLCQESPILEDVKPKIRIWLKENLKHLIISAACRYTNINQVDVWKENIKVEKSTTMTPCRICPELFTDKNVRRFPCFFNVSRATFNLLRGQLKKLCSREGGSKGKCPKICFMVDDVVVKVYHPWKRKCRYSFDEGKAEYGKKCRRSPNAQGHIINPAVHTEFGKVHAKLWYGVEYWDIICQASKFDRDPDSFGKYLVRKVLKIEGNNKLARQKLYLLAQILGKALQELEGLAETAEKAEQYINSLQQENLRLRPYIINPELVAVMSISHGMASRINLKDNEKKKEDAKCLDFWKARYVFSGTETNETFEGVALDTITGKVWNANMTYKDDLCPREGWNCSLTRVTKRRWEKYVEKYVDKDGIHYSLIRFDDKYRFMPEDVGLRLDCAEGIPTRGSILLSPI